MPRHGLQKLIIIGAGDYYRTILGPSLEILKNQGIVEVLATVSINENEGIKDTKHLIRHPAEKLSHLLENFQNLNPIVILGHTTELHTDDAEDLVRHGFRVLVEKPYCIDTSQLNTMRTLLRQYPDNIGLMEYYLMMKTIPLFVIAGKIHEDSFYNTEKNILQYFPPFQSATLHGAIKDILGTPRQIYVDLLEGEGPTGVLEHRGSALTDTQKGGGMIQDLGTHALVALFALQDYIGTIDPSFQKGAVRVARCQEYVYSMKKLFSLPEERIAESYAELEFKTSRDVPVFAAVGKYLPANANQRRIIITGSEGRIYLNLSSCTLYGGRGENPEVTMLACPKKADTKYYPVLRAALGVMDHKSPFVFDANKIALDTQQFVLHAAEKSRTGTQDSAYAVYRHGARACDIFHAI